MFRLYNKISYPIIINGVEVYKTLVDITTSLKLSYELIENGSMFDYYQIQDGDTPEVIAYKIYDNPKLAYLVMIANEKFDWRNDYPLTDSQLFDMCQQKYSNMYGVHHYINSTTGLIIEPVYDPQSRRFISVEDQVFVDSNHTTLGEFVIPITNYDYEQDVNDQKRHIKLIKPELSESVVKLITEALS